jgi:hypothetical protein
MQGEEAIVKCGTSKGPIEMKFYRDWSPNGYDRATYLYEQVSSSLVAVLRMMASSLSHLHVLLNSLLTFALFGRDFSMDPTFFAPFQDFCVSLESPSTFHIYLYHASSLGCCVFVYVYLIIVIYLLCIVQLAGRKSS